MWIYFNCALQLVCSQLTLAPGFPAEPTGPRSPISPCAEKGEMIGRQRGWVLIRHTENRKNNRNSSRQITHRFTNRSIRSHLSLFSTLTLWCDSEMTQWHIRGDIHHHSVFTHVIFMLTVLPADPSVPGRPGWPESPCAETSKAAFRFFQLRKKKTNKWETTNDLL